MSVCVCVCIPPPFLCWFGASPEGTQAELGPVSALLGKLISFVQIGRVANVHHYVELFCEAKVTGSGALGVRWCSVYDVPGECWLRSKFVFMYVV